MSILPHNIDIYFFEALIMTYKNTKFEDSAVMRSFEKIAIKKGLVKPEEIKKEAAPKKASLQPTQNFEENVLKLCSALRDRGFQKQASEIEENFFTFKKAQYNVFKETGEDLIDWAHPTGGTQIDGLTGPNSIVETILERKKKMEEVALKQPALRLTKAELIAERIKNAGNDNNSALNAIRIILAQENVENDKSTGLTLPIVNQVMGYFKSIDDSIDSFSSNFLGLNNEGVLNYNRLRALFVKYIDNKNINNETISILNKSIDDTISAFSKREAHSLFMISTSVENILFQLKSLKNYLADFIIENHKSLMNSSSAIKKSDENYTLLNQNYNKLIYAVQSKANVLETTKPENYKATFDWLVKAYNLLKKDQQELTNNIDRNNPEIISHFTDRLNSLKEKLRQVPGIVNE